VGWEEKMAEVTNKGYNQPRMKYTVVLSADARRHIRYLLRQGIMSRGSTNAWSMQWQPG
jgi:hypothetical protein